MKTPDERREYMRQYMAKRRLDPVQTEKNRAASRKWREANRDTSRAASRSWREKNPERVKASIARWHIINAEYRAEYQKAEYRRTRRATHLQNKFGISEEQYAAMLVVQKGHCALCPWPDLPEKRLAVDHNHITGKIRALLCADCNRGLGLLGDDADRLRAAAEYLEAHKLTPK